MQGNRNPTGPPLVLVVPKATRWISNLLDRSLHAQQAANSQTVTQRGRCSSRHTYRQPQQKGALPTLKHVVRVEVNNYHRTSLRVTTIRQAGPQLQAYLHEGTSWRSTCPSATVTNNNSVRVRKQEVSHNRTFFNAFHLLAYPSPVRMNGRRPRRYGSVSLDLDISCCSDGVGSQRNTHFMRVHYLIVESDERLSNRHVRITVYMHASHVFLPQRIKNLASAWCVTRTAGVDSTLPPLGHHCIWPPTGRLPSKEQAFRNDSSRAM